ncbi:MAG TPA: malate synthase A, partial [Polyangiaceae bacterium]|nr:malate synthase A [Polyangiaceae bacterium]
MPEPLQLPPGVSLNAPAVDGQAAVLSPGALALVAELARRFGPRIRALLAERRERQARYDAGELPDFDPATAELREADWRASPLPAALADRRVEITGPVDRKMIINALNSGANVFMADFEDSTSPTWANLVRGQQNLYDAVRRTITYQAPDGGKAYRLAERTATLMVRPRGLHLPERHLLVDGAPAPGALVDFGLFFFHNARELAARGEGPFFYLPKLESGAEAKVWDDAFRFAQGQLGLPVGTVRATVLIETLPAAFQMHEIVHALREHAAGLNCGRWDYIFSFIKKLRGDPTRVLPDRSLVTMDRAFLRAYSRLLIETCHRRGVHAMGGMAAQIPIKDDPARNAEALAKVRADKEREARDGHDGTWVAHPGLVGLAREVFDQLMPGPNQIDRPLTGERASRDELLRVHEGPRTERGLRHNVRVGVQYLEAWLRGLGCVPLYDLMEDAATAEISRAQVWQWLRHRAPLEGAPGPLTEARLGEVVREEMALVRRELGEARFAEGRFDEATELFVALATAPEFGEFLTLPAYERLVA